MPRTFVFARLGAILLGACAAFGAAHAQTRLSNTAELTYQSNGVEQTVSSNTVYLDVPRSKQPTTLRFRLLPPNFQLTGMRCEPAANTFTPAEIDASTLARSPELQALDITTPLILVLEADGENRDPTIRETTTIEVTAGPRQGTMPLLETAPDSGIFGGGVPASGTFPELSACDLTLERGNPVMLRFAETPYSLGSSATELVDPAGYVFDSRTGEPINGATVTLLDERGQPARVLGEDGVSIYPSTVVTGAAVHDASGRTYPAITGRYRFPLSAPGIYTLRIEPPTGYSAPSTADRASLAQVHGPGGMAYMINDASFGGSLTLTDAPFFADIPIDKARAAELLVTKTASVREASPGDFIQYRIQLTNRGATPATAIGISDTLPLGLRYERGSARGGAEPVVAPDGRTLTFAIPSLAGGGSTELRYVVTVAPGAPLGEALNRARVTGPGLTSNEAAASVRLRALLFTDAMTIIGRVTEGRCGDPADHRRGIAGVRLLMEDGTFVVTDRDGLYHFFEGVRAGRHVVQIDRNSVPATHTPLACDTDTRQAGSAISRFLEGVGGLLKRVDFQLAPTGKSAPAAEALPIEVASDATAAGSQDWLAGQEPGIAWLFPAADHNPRAPALRVAIKHAPGQHVALTVNGVRTDPLNFDGMDVDATRGVAVSRWSGVRLDAGDNRLSARVLSDDGRLIQALDRVVHNAGAGVRADFDAAHSRLVADGITRPLIAVRVTDKDGRAVRAGTLVPFRVDQPYVAHVEAELEQGRQLAGRERNAITARVVGDDGIAFIVLQPTTQAGAAHVVVTLTEEKQVRSTEVRAWLSASVKDWTVVGFGAGTIGYDMLKSRSTALPRSQRDHVVTDGQLAFYAKGRVKGSWLMTIAYDSDRRYDPDRGLLGTIDPDRYYTVYGDGALQGYDAPTRRKLYLRLERRQVYALFGDFETGFTETQLMRYNRTLNGVKAAYEGDRVRASAFAAKTDSLYGRDEIQGNGLSGPYRLAGRDIVPNSDKLRVEVRDRFRSERILSSRQLTRHIDYDIDSSAGTFRFREPVLSRDQNQNPIFIVAEYEVESGRIGKLAAAAHAGLKLAGGRAEIGAGAIRDETVSNATVVGLDARAKIGRSTELRGEVATGGRDGLGKGIAYLAEAEHHGKALDLLGYVRQQEMIFGVGQQNFVEAGTRKVGVDGRMQLTSRLSATGTAWYQDQLDDAGRRTAADVRLEYRRDTGTIFIGGQIADDNGVDGRARRSRLLTLGGTQGLLGGKLELTEQTQIAPGGQNDSVDFPIRHQLTAGYRINRSVRLIGGYEIANGKDFAAHTARIGFDLAPWSGAKLMSTLNQQAIGENGRRTYAQYGLNQSLPLGKRWTVDGTLDASSTIRGRIPQGATINAFQPVASGGSLSQDQTNGSFTAATLGATYRAERWSINGRLEYRTSTANDRLDLTTSFLRTLGEGKTLASSIKAYRLKDRTGSIANSISADVALALRPLDSRWSLLERLELRHEGADAAFDDRNVLGVPAYGAGDQVTSRVVNNLAINYRTGAEGAGHGLEGTIYHGAKYVRGRYADEVFDGLIDAIGFELREDLGTRLDIGVQGSMQHAWSRGAIAFSVGPSVGASPAPNVWISAGYNVAGYRDHDFERDRYTRQGPYVTMRLKFDQLSLRALGRAGLGVMR